MSLLSVNYLSTWLDESGKSTFQTSEYCEKELYYIAPNFLEENVLQRQGNRTEPWWRQAGGLRVN